MHAGLRRAEPGRPRRCPARLGGGSGSGSRQKSRDGPQVVDAARRLPLGGAAADVDAAQLSYRSGLLEVLDEARVFPDNSAVCLARYL